MPVVSYAIIIVLSILLIIPPFIHDYIAGHDLTTHFNYTELFFTQLFAGDLYPRWLFDMNGGRGSPVFYFYSPLPYYISAISSLLLPTANSTWHSMAITCCLALMISSLGVFRFLCMLTNSRKALLFTLLYMLNPYYIPVDLLLRFAFTEFFAMAWVPFLFIFAKQLAEGRKFAGYGLSLTYALLILSHIPTTMLVTPFFLTYYCVTFKHPAKPFDIVAPLAFSGGMTAFYLLPIIALINDVSIGRMTTGRFNYEKAFLFSNNEFTSVCQDFTSLLGTLSIITAVVALTAFLSQRKPDRLLFFFAGMSIISIFMMFSPSQPAWQLIPLLKIVQFPWRFFIVVSLSIYFLAAHASRDDSMINVYFCYQTIAIMSVLSIITIYSIYLNMASDMNGVDRSTIVKSLSTRRGPDEYFSAGTPESYFQRAATRTLDRVDSLFEGKSQPVTSSFFIDGDRLTVTIETPLKQPVVFNQFYFPTWRGEDTIDGEYIALQRTTDGLLEFTLEKGHHSIVFFHKKTAAEYLGIIISLLAFSYVIIRLFSGLRSPEALCK